jgi:hypothetical protein
MELLVQREPSTLSSTPGTLSIDGVFEWAGGPPRQLIDKNKLT